MKTETDEYAMTGIDFKAARRGCGILFIYLVVVLAIILWIL